MYHILARISNHTNFISNEVYHWQERYHVPNHREIDGCWKLNRASPNHKNQGYASLTVPGIHLQPAYSLTKSQQCGFNSPIAMSCFAMPGIHLYTRFRCRVSRCKVDSRLAPSQWDMSLQSKAVSHWLGANLDSTLKLSWMLTEVTSMSCYKRQKLQNVTLTDCGLATPYGDRNLGQHWLRLWLVAWRHQAIT